MTAPTTYPHLINTEFKFLIAATAAQGSGLTVKVYDTNFTDLLATYTIGSGIVELGTDGFYTCTVASAILDARGKYPVTIVSTIPVFTDTFLLAVENIDYESIRNGLLIAGGQTNTLTIEDDDSNLLENVLVRICANIDGTNPIVQGYTNASGVLTFYTPSTGTYYAFIFLSGYSYSNPETITAPVTDTLEMTTILVSPTAADICRVYGYLKNLEGTVLANAEVWVTLYSFYAVDDNVFRVALDRGVGYKKRVRTNATGYFYFDLPQGSVAELEIPGAQVKGKLTVPALASKSLEELLNSSAFESEFTVV